MLVEAYLAPALIPFCQQHPALRLNGWVDDIGFDCEGEQADQLARNTIQAWQQLQTGLQTMGLKVNKKKTAFIPIPKPAGLPNSDWAPMTPQWQR